MIKLRWLRPEMMAHIKAERMHKTHTLGDWYFVHFQRGKTRCFSYNILTHRLWRNSIYDTRMSNRTW